MPKITNNDHTIYYEKIGEGIPIVLLHGVFTSGQEWIQNGYLNYLSGYTVILMDLRGHGKSGNYYEYTQYDPKLQASDIKCVLDREEIDKAIVWGYSFGGRIAFAFGVYYPEYVISMIVGGMHPYPVTNVFSAIRKRMNIFVQGMDHWLNHLETKGIKTPPDKRSILLENDPRALYANDQSILEWQGFGTDLSHLNTVAIFLYVGENDRSYRKGATEFSQSFPQTTYKILPKLHHFSAYTNSQVVCQEVITYLNEADLN